MRTYKGYEIRKVTTPHFRHWVIYRGEHGEYLVNSASTLKYAKKLIDGMIREGQ